MKQLLSFVTSALLKTADIRVSLLGDAEDVKKLRACHINFVDVVGPMVVIRQPQLADELWYSKRMEVSVERGLFPHWPPLDFRVYCTS